MKSVDSLPQCPPAMQLPFLEKYIFRVPVFVSQEPMCLFTADPLRWEHEEV